MRSFEDRLFAACLDRAVADALIGCVADPTPRVLAPPPRPNRARRRADADNRRP